MTTHNNTSFANIEQQIAGLLHPIKRGRNNWRGRDIVLYEHPTDPSRLISDGTTFDKSMRVIADESRDEWARELSHTGDFITN